MSIQLSSDVKLETYMISLSCADIPFNDSSVPNAFNLFFFFWKSTKIFYSGLSVINIVIGLFFYWYAYAQRVRV